MSESEPWIADECNRIAARRTAVGLKAEAGGGKAHALALSGGGIRSATFSLGLLQGLQRAYAPAQFQDPADRKIGTGPRRVRLLRVFDFLSTVSGGGFIGSFFGSLFVPGRLRPVSSPEMNLKQQLKMFAGRIFKRAEMKEESNASPAAAPGTDRDLVTETAYQVLEDDPPGRIRTGEPYDPLRRPLAWLRENGRYLTPTGAGDMLYVIALAIRNWFAVQYVLGTVLFLVLTFVALTKSAITVVAPAVQRLYPAIPGFDFFAMEVWEPPVGGGFHAWWSPIWALPVIVILVRIAPAGLAFWLVRPQKETDVGFPGRVMRALSLAAVLDALVAVMLGVVAWRIQALSKPLSLFLGVITAITALGAIYHGWTALSTKIADEQRVLLTRRLASGLLALLICSAVALVDTLGQSFYLWVMQPQSSLWSVGSWGALLSAAVWIAKKAAALPSDAEKPKWLEALPTEALAGAAAALLLLAIATTWAVFTQWLVWKGAMPGRITGGLLAGEGNWNLGLFLVAFALAAISGLFPGFINLSTLQAFYSARLTRAYLGGSNGARFAEADKSRWNSVAEPHPADQVARDRYYGRDVFAPVHIVNVTMNQTIDPAEQLVQRDRKGKPLAIVPSGYLLDGKYLAYGGKTEDLTLGQWVGVSGAAFSTGLGRATSLGMSLLLGLANVRLGTWWRSDFWDKDSKDDSRKGAEGLENLALKIFPTQTYLIYEFLGRFQGNHRPLQYLSDGGHFENTAVYELLRPSRDIHVIVASDNGCDPKYQFNDLANLIRLARIDFGASIESVTEFPKDSPLERFFGREGDFHPPNPGKSEKCALLFKVSYRDESARERWLIIVKPTLVSFASTDVMEYQKRCPSFPQQSTADQFFDEAQWESYRKLGLDIATKLFDDHGDKLWEGIFNGFAPRPPEKAPGSFEI